MIRESRIEDLPGIIRVIHESFRSCVQDHQRNESEIQIWLEKNRQSDLLLMLLYNDSWVYVVQDVVVGFMLVNDEGEILMNYIDPAVQQQGIGKALLQNTIECMRAKKIRQMTLDSTYTALPFYKKQGFLPITATPSDASRAMTNLVKFLS